jgi:hypothetical protein
MSAVDRPTRPFPASPEPVPITTRRSADRDVGRVPQRYRSIVVVGGGCYGSYYVRQLVRANAVGALGWDRLIVVDRDAECRVARERISAVDVATSAWAPWFASFFDATLHSAHRGSGDAIVPSPLMPHLLFDWLVDRAQARWPERRVAVTPVGTVGHVPWQRPSADGATHYVSFAEWMCPINCIEPARCPATRGSRSWTMPAAIAEYTAGERAAGHNVSGPFVFHCTHRAYGVGMIDVDAVLAADTAITAAAANGPARFIIGTASHCHGALGRLEID